MAKVIYHAPEGDDIETMAFGFSFTSGLPTDVNDEKALAKLSNNRCFTVEDDSVMDVMAPETANVSYETNAVIVEPVQPKRRGRPPKQWDNR